MKKELGDRSMDDEEVKVHGMWGSFYVYKVMWALKLKGVEYEYIEEDLSNKSDLLLEYNPIYKKVSVLVHAGKPVPESGIILEYIDEKWPHKYPLFPQHPFDRALARFWISFGVEKSMIFYEFFRAGEGRKEEAGRKAFEVLKIIEEQGLGSKKFFGGDSINAVDISFGWLPGWFECMEEVVGVKVLEPTKLPRLSVWLDNFKEVAVVDQNFPAIHRLMEYNRKIRASMNLS